MDHHFLFSIAFFCFATCATPGPNNLMLLASGVNYGLRKTSAHIVGINIGFGFMVLLIGVGLAGVFEAYPHLHTSLKWGAIIFMLYLAWKIATAVVFEDTSLQDEGGTTPSQENLSKKQAQQDKRPLQWWQAALFQWVNPKAWAMSFSAVAAYVPHIDGRASMLHLLVLVLMFVLINLPVGVVWTLFGVYLRAWLIHERNCRAFNYIMALLLVLSLAPML